MKATTIAEPAQSGFASAAAYDAHRPSYAPEAVDQFLQCLQLKGVRGAKVADLAAGTGKFTELLAARPEEYEVVAIEPHDGMREQMQRKSLPRVEVLSGAAESMPDVADASLACVVAAQAFHWFANMDALREIARVLQATGVLGMIWNIEDCMANIDQTDHTLTEYRIDNSPLSWKIHSGWESKMRDVIWTFDDDSPRFRHDKWREVFDAQVKVNPLALQSDDTLFGLPLGESSVEFETWLSKDDVWSRLRTLSQLAILEGEELEKVKKTFFDSVNSEDTKTDESGRIAVHGRTEFFWTNKIPTEPLKSDA